MCCDQPMRDDGDRSDVIVTLVITLNIDQVIGLMFLYDSLW